MPTAHGRNVALTAELGGWVDDMVKSANTEA